MLITFFVIVSLSFFAMKLLPGSPYRNAAKLGPELVAQLNHQYGFDKPIPVQYINYLNKVLHGDLGVSFQYEGRTVNSILASKVPVSADLGIEATIIGVLIGIILGAIAALRRGTWLDYGVMVIAVLGISVPSFILAQLMQYYFGVQLRWLPVAKWDGIESHIMPVIALAVGSVAVIARYMRNEMIGVLGSDYIDMARAKGLSRPAVVIKHAMRNSLVPIATIVIPSLMTVITGSLVIENIFAIPGIGDQFVSSIVTNDYPVIMGTTILFSIFFLVGIFLTDLAYGVIDPRIRVAGGDS